MMSITTALTAEPAINLPVVLCMNPCAWRCPGPSPHTPRAFFIHRRFCHPRHGHHDSTERPSVQAGRRQPHVFCGGRANCAISAREPASGRVITTPSIGADRQTATRPRMPQDSDKEKDRGYRLTRSIIASASSSRFERQADRHFPNPKPEAVRRAKAEPNSRKGERPPNIRQAAHFAGFKHVRLDLRARKARSHQ